MRPFCRGVDFEENGEVKNQGKPYSGSIRTYFNGILRWGLRRFMIESLFGRREKKIDELGDTRVCVDCLFDRKGIER